MSRLLLWAVAPLLALGMLLVQAEPAQAQWRGGRGGWGGYGGGWGSGSGFSIGIGPRYSYGYSPYRTYGHGYYPHSYGYSRYYPSTSTFYTPSYTYGSAPSVSYASFYGDSTSTEDDNRVRVNLRVAADAKVTFEGVATNQTGMERQFVSPPLTPGSTYSYEIVAQWQENGQAKERKETVRVHAGDVINLNMTQSRATANEAPPVTERRPVEPAATPAPRTDRPEDPAATPRPAIPSERNPLPDSRPRTVPEP